MGSTRNRTGGTRTRGLALPTALLVLVVLTLLGAAAAFLAATEQGIAGNGRQELRTLALAEGGVHEALARLNMKSGSPPNRIVPQEAGGNPVANWTQSIVNQGTLGPNEVQTITGAFGTTTALPVTTTIRYKKEDAAERPLHCDDDDADGQKDDCGNQEVVRFHEAFAYSGTTVPTGTQVGLPVLQITSTYSDALGNAREVRVDAVRTITSIGTPGTVRACGQITCAGSPNTVDGSAHPVGGAVVSGSGTNPGCNDSRVDPNPSGDPDAVQTQPCPADPNDLFKDVFGITRDQLRDLADIVTPAPYNPPSMNGKIVYVTGSGVTSTWDGNKIFGTSNQSSSGAPVNCNREPVIVVVEGNLNLAGTIDFCGIIYVTGNLSFGAGNFKLRGAIVAQGNANVSLTGNSNFTYDPTVIDNLRDLTPYMLITWDANR